MALTHKFKKRGAIASVALLLVVASACGSSKKSSSTPTTAATATTAAATATTAAATATTATGASGATTTASGGSTAGATTGIKKGLTIYYIPKDTQNPYEVLADKGGESALTELGGKVVVSSGTEDTAAAQIPSIQAAIAAKADAIVIAANDPDALCPSLAQAQAAGMVVVAFDSDNNCPNHLFINQADTATIGTAEVDYMATLIGSKGEVAILSAAATATNQNAWIDHMKTQFAKYPNMKLVDTVYGNDDPATSLTVLQGLLSAHPNLAGIISPTTVGISTAAQYLSTHKDVKVQLTGLGLPSQMKPYVKDGTVKGFMLWNPSDLGYLAGYAAASLASKTVVIKDGATFTAGKLKDYKIAVPATGSANIVLGPPTVFDAANIDQFNF